MMKKIACWLVATATTTACVGLILHVFQPRPSSVSGVLLILYGPFILAGGAAFLQLTLLEALESRFGVDLIPVGDLLQPTEPQRERLPFPLGWEPYSPLDDALGFESHLRSAFDFGADEGLFRDVVLYEQAVLRLQLSTEEVLLQRKKDFYSQHELFRFLEQSSATPGVDEVLTGFTPPRTKGEWNVYEDVARRQVLDRIHNEWVAHLREEVEKEAPTP